MQFTDEQNAAAVLAALEHNATRTYPRDTDDVVSLVQVVLTAIPEAVVDAGAMNTMQATLADSLTRFMEIAAGQRAAAEAAGFSPTASEMMGATAYQALLMKMATG